MEGSSSGLAGHLDDILPKAAHYVLAWNPPQLLTESVPKADVTLPTLPPPDTAPPAAQTKSSGTTHQAAFYDKHLAPHLILKHVIYLNTLVSAMANTVDQAIQSAVAERPLPKNIDRLPSENAIKLRDEETSLTKYRELGVAEFYSHFAAEYCRPIASTLALHPSSEYWGSILDWTLDGKIGRWEIADGVLRISHAVFANDKLKKRMLQNEPDGKKDILNQLADRAAALAVWEMKSLTVGTGQVMEEIVEMGLTHVEFPWKCTLTVCNHKFLASMEEASKDYYRGVDPHLPPWTLPIVPSTSTADSRPTSLPKSLRSVSAQGGTTARPSYKEPSISPVEDGKGDGKKRRRNDAGASKHGRPPKKSKTGLMDKSYVPPTSARLDDNAQSFLQQVA